VKYKIKEEANWTCRRCGLQVEEGDPDGELVVDHITPYSKGGPSTEDNLQCLCWECNQEKLAEDAEMEDMLQPEDEPGEPSRRIKIADESRIGRPNPSPLGIPRLRLW